MSTRLNHFCGEYVHHFFYFTLYVVDGGWTDWTSWSSCLHTCGRHSRSHRTRTCSNPAPLFGGQHCLGHHLDIRACNIGPCPGKKNAFFHNL